jgi:D-alanyl-D-alanine dipeptidase
MRHLAFLATLLGLTLDCPAELLIPKTCDQVVCVVTPDWTTPAGTLQRWQRGSRAVGWEKVGAPISVLVGDRGLGWGLGLHRVPQDGAPRKVEGDRRAPAGMFRITGAFGRGPAVGQLPWQAITPTLEAIDDPASRFYNGIVDRQRVGLPDWHSSEHMVAIPDYALGLVVAHNPQNVRGAGSCIFLHLWRGERRGTAGCTILRERDLVTLARWLDPARQPILIQLPREVARRELDGF